MNISRSHLKAQSFRASIILQHLTLDVTCIENAKRLDRDLGLRWHICIARWPGKRAFPAVMVKRATDQTTGIYIKPSNKREIEGQRTRVEKVEERPKASTHVLIWNLLAREVLAN